MPSKIHIDLVVKSKKWLAKKTLEKFIAKTARQLILLCEIGDFAAQKSKQIELSISLVSNAQMKKINLQFRGQNKATNVLSFPFLDEAKIRKNGLLKHIENFDYVMLGDIVLSLEIIEKEALLAKKSLKEHISHLLLHGILHLLGHDHENEQDAKVMEKLEIAILQKIGIKNPYILRD